MYSVTPWKEGLYQPLSSIMSSVNPNSLCKKSLNFDLSIFSPLASASNTPNKPITSSLVTEIAKIKIQFFYRLYITMQQFYCTATLLCTEIPVWDFIHTLKGYMLHRGFTTSHWWYLVLKRLVSKRLIIVSKQPNSISAKSFQNL